MNGEASHAFMGDSARTLSRVMPQAQHRILAGQDHNVSPDVVAPVLLEFFAA